MARPNVDNPEHRAIAEPNIVLLGLVGSTVHGVTVDAADDRDELGICIEPPEYVVGLRGFEQWVYRTQPEGSRSGPGDVDRPSTRCESGAAWRSRATRPSCCFCTFR